MKYKTHINSTGAKNLYFIGSDIFRKESFGNLHPLSGKRISSVIDLCISMEWLSNKSITQSRPANFQTLSILHDPNYIQAIFESDKNGIVSRSNREKYSLGTMENPLFKGLYERAAATVGGSILAANKVAQGGVAYHPSGGTHHGKPARADGFCYFNDPAFAIETFLEQGMSRVAYVDLDAHHGDGVQEIFQTNNKVWTFSIHETDRWPYSGAVDDHGGGQSYNFPVAHGINDSEFDYILDNIINRSLKPLKPEAIVITLGADGLAGDPLSKMNLSNSALWNAVSKLINLSPSTVILGGGGYNPWTTLRCWAGLWAHMIGADVTAPLSPAARRILEELESDLIDEDEIEESWVSSLIDIPNTGPVRQDIVALTHSALADYEQK